jgi:MFS family permease
MADLFGLSSFAIGLIFSAGSVAMTLSSSQAGRFNKKISIHLLLVIAFVIYLASTAVVPYIRVVVLLVVPLLVFNLAYGMIIPSIMAAIAQKAPVEYRAAVISINTSTFRLGQTIAPPLMTLAFGTGGFKAVYFGAAFLALVAAVIAGLSGRIKYHSEIQGGMSER